MTIRLKHAQGKLEAIELFQLQHHLAISRLKHYLQVKGSKHCKLIKRISVSHSSLNEKDFIALHDILKLSSKVNEISFYANHIEANQVTYLFDSLPNKNLNRISFIDNWIGDKISPDFFSFLQNKNFGFWISH